MLKFTIYRFTGLAGHLALVALFAVQASDAAAESCIRAYQALSDEYDEVTQLTPGSPEHVDAVLDLENRIFARLDSCPDHPRLLALLSECEIGIGRYVFAEHYARRIVDTAPDFWRGHVVLGWVLVSTDRYDEGLQELERGATLVPDNIMVRLNLCQAYVRAGRREAAHSTCGEVARSGEPEIAARAQKLLERIGP
jgi:predicted Zn-dependent protease